MTLSADQRRALDMLANAGHGGVTQSLLTMYGVHPGMVAELVSGGLATMTQEKARAAGGEVDVAMIRITEAGRNALAAKG
jgi:3,4-dihydroxy-2-butanone 4-phosphate synthase